MNVYFLIYLTNRGVNLWQRKLLLFVLFFFFLYFNVHSEEEKVIFLLSLGVRRKGIVWNLASSVSFFSFLLLWLDGKLEKLVEGEELYFVKISMKISTLILYCYVNILSAMHFAVSVHFVVSDLQRIVWTVLLFEWITDSFPPTKKGRTFPSNGYSATIEEN